MKNDLRVFAAHEIKLVFYAFLFGIAAAAVYDVFRMIRTFFGCGLKSEKHFTEYALPLIGKQKQHKNKLGKHISDAALILFDLLYMLAFAVSVTLFYYSYNDGIVRWYTLLGIGIGFFTYMKTVGVVTRKTVGAILFALVTLCRYAWYFGIKPFILLKKIYAKTLGRAYGRLLCRRSAALTEKYIDEALTKKLDEISSVARADNAEKEKVTNYA